jgi:hypothetical protein
MVQSTHQFCRNHCRYPLGWLVLGYGSYVMAIRPSDLADRIYNRRDPDDGFSEQTFTLPVEAARLKVREILNQNPQGDDTRIVERWRQLPNGQIEFMMRRLRATD